LGPGAVAAGRDITGPVTVNVTHRVSDWLRDAIFDPAPLRDVLDLDRFTGRDWIIGQIDEFIATQRRGYVMVQAEAGVGKSALAAHLVFTRSCAYHFTRIEGARSPEQARRSLAAQLIGHWQLHDLAPGQEFPAGADRPDWLLKVIRAAAGKRDAAGDGSPLVLVVDGLDEADPPSPGQDTGIPLGLPRPENLPPGVFFVVTTRFGVALHAVRGPVDWRTIIVDSPDNLADMRTYLRDILTGDHPDRQLAARLAEHKSDPKLFIDKVARRCGGIWMYLRYVLDDISSGRRTPTTLDGLPTDLLGYYLEQVHRWSSRTGWSTIGLPIFATLAALRRPAVRAELAALAGADTTAVQPWVDHDLRPFLDQTHDSQQRRVYSLRHQSLRDLFQPDPTSPERETLHDALQQAHHRITTALTPPGPIQDRDWSQVDAYTRTALPEHAAANGQLDNLTIDPGFLLTTNPADLLRHKPAVVTSQARAALAAYELTVDRWQTLPDNYHRLRWLDVWAHKTRAAQLAEHATDLSPDSWSIHTAMWTGTPHRTLIGHTDPVQAVCAVPMPDGRVLLASGSNDTVRLWDPPTGLPAGDPLVGHTGSVRALCAVPTPDGRILLASAGDDRTVRLWDLSTGLPAGDPLVGHTDWVWALCAVPTPDGRILLASAGSDRTVRLWDLSTGLPAGDPLVGHTGSVRALCAVPTSDGRILLASAGDGDMARLWDPSTGQPCEVSLIGHTGLVWTVCAVPMPDGRTVLASAGDGHMARLWDLSTGQPAGDPLVGHTDWVWALCAVPTPDGHILLASAGNRRTVRLWDLSTGQTVDASLTGHTGPVRAVCAVPMPDGRTLLASAGEDHTVRLWDLFNTPPAVDPVIGHTGPVSALCAVPMPDGRTVLASAGEDSTVRLWDVSTGQPAGDPLTGRTGPVSLCAVTMPDGRTLLACYGDRFTVQLWDPSTGQPAGDPLTGHTGPLSTLCAVTMPDGRTLLASAGGDETVRLWDLSTAEPASVPLTGHTDTVSVVCAVTMPDGRTLLASAGRDAVRLWDLSIDQPTGVVLWSQPYGVRAFCAVPMPDGRPLLAHDGDGHTVGLWDVSTGQPASVSLIGHTGLVRAVCAVPMPDGRPLLASAADDNTVRLWDLSTGQPASAPLIGHTDSVRAVCAVPMPDGRPLLASAGEDHTVLVWAESGAPIGAFHRSQE
jgi:WD40 repeat protein